MTTIAISDGVVACDTQLTGGNYAVRVQKLVRLKDGGVAAGCGNWREAHKGLQWLAAGEQGEAPEIEGASIAILRPDGSIEFAEGGFPAYPVLDRTFTLGCGQDLARMALSEGCTAVEAVAKACELDAMSSGPIMSMEAVAPTEMPGPSLHSYTVKPAGAKAKIRGSRR